MPELYKRAAAFLVPRRACVRVFLVKGAEVRAKVDPQFKGGGNYADEIWLDAELKPSELRVKLAELEAPKVDLPELELIPEVAEKVARLITFADLGRPDLMAPEPAPPLRLPSPAAASAAFNERVAQAYPIPEIKRAAAPVVSPLRPQVTLGELIEKAASPAPVPPSEPVPTPDPGPPILSQEPLSRLQRLTEEPIGEDARLGLFAPDAMADTIRRIEATSKRLEAKRD